RIQLMIQFRDGFYADVRTEDRSRTTITYKSGALEEMKTRVERRAFIRVYDGKMWYYSSVTDLAHLQKTLDGLYDAATPNADIQNDPVVRRFERNRDTLLSFADSSVRDIPPKDKQALLLSYLPLLSEDSCVTMPRGTYLDRNSLFRFRSSLGADITYDYQTCGLSFSCDMTEGEKKFSGHWQKGATRFDELKGLDDEIRAAMAEQTAFMRNSVPVTPGKYPVVLSPEAAGVFAHESFGHKSESDFMLSDETMRDEWQLGKTVGSPILSIAECGSVPGCGYVPYDDEGTKARKNYLIKDGKLVGRLHNAQTAAVLDEPTTGNARAIDCTFEPIVRMTTTYIEGGDMDFDELIAPIKKGYFIKTIKHGSGMSTFTIAPNLAYEITDGKLGRPVQISVITGSVFETLGLIDGLTRDVKLLSFVTGGCGKMEQMGLPVGFGGPYVRVSSMNVQ
ncbi:MAG: TldD/PmbA family protein, partial [Ruminococcus sp.]|nr:TldD/PmbA family protein [Ruminococcus sp.]